MSMLFCCRYRCSCFSLCRHSIHLCTAATPLVSSSVQSSPRVFPPPPHLQSMYILAVSRQCGGSYDMFGINLAPQGWMDRWISSATLTTICATDGVFTPSSRKLLLLLLLLACHQGNSNCPGLEDVKVFNVAAAAARLETCIKRWQVS